MEPERSAALNQANNAYAADEKAMQKAAASEEAAEASRANEASIERQEVQL